MVKWLEMEKDGWRLLRKESGWIVKKGCCVCEFKKLAPALNYWREKTKE